ncbi:MULTISPECIES: hypothetical protein [Methanothrix]|jgi:hypothetical protein|nr:hypothetical protein [Methanothrix soehngenii]
MIEIIRAVRKNELRALLDLYKNVNYHALKGMACLYAKSREA